MSTSDFISDIISKQGFIFKYAEIFPSSEHDVYELQTWLEDKDQIKYDYKKICVRDRDNPREVAFKKLLDSIIENYYENVSNKSNGRFIVIEDFNDTINIVTDYSGEVKVFYSYEDAKKEADDCQNGKIVKL